MEGGRTQGDTESPPLILTLQCWGCHHHSSAWAGNLLCDVAESCLIKIKRLLLLLLSLLFFFLLCACNSDFQFLPFCPLVQVGIDPVATHEYLYLEHGSVITAATPTV